MINEKSFIEFEDDQEDLEIVRAMKKIKCKVLLEGYKPILMNFYFCSCDPHQKDPICEECAKICHSNHSLSALYKGEQICQCGLKCHKTENNTLHDQFYDPRCNYHELSIFSNLNIYYENEKKLKICIFCYNFCYNTNEFVKKIAKNEEVPQCECVGHNEIKFIFQSTNELAINRKIENLNSTHLLNLLFLCEKSFKNIYSSFSLFYNQLKIDILDPLFEFDSNIQLSNSFWALSNFASLSNLTWDFNYFSEKVRALFDIDFAYQLFELNSKNDNLAVWIFKNNLICCFEKITVGFDFISFPQLKINDFENLTPFQRLTITLKIRGNEKFMEKYILKEKRNIIDILLQYVEILTKSKFSKFVCFEILIRIFNIMKKFAKFYLFTNEQKLKYCIVIEEIFEKFNEDVSINQEDKNILITKENELKTIKTIIETLLFFSLNYNDEIILQNINQLNKEFNFKFLHSKNELGKNISKYCINIMNYFNKDLTNDFIHDVSSNLSESRSSGDSNNDEMEIIREKKFSLKSNDDLKELYKDKNKILKKILVNTIKILSLFVNNPDFYQIGLRRNINLSKNEINSMYLNGFLKYNKKDDFINFQESCFSILELEIYKYFNFKLGISELIGSLERIIQEFFKFIDKFDITIPINNKNKIKRHPNSESIYKDENKTFHKLTNIDSKVSDKQILLIKDNSYKIKKYQILMNKSFLIFTIIKILKIYYNSEQLNRDFKQENKLLSAIMKLLYFYVDNNPDNCIIVLSIQILSVLISVSPNNLEIILNFLFSCLKCISVNKFELVSSLKLVKYFHLCFEKSLKTDSNKLNCIKTYLKICKKVALHIPTLFHSVLIEKLRENLVIIYRKCNFLNEIRDYYLLLGKDAIFKETDEIIFKKTDIPEIAEILLKEKIFTKYLSLINICFDDNSLFTDYDFLSKIFSSNEIKIFLRNPTLDLKLRTEILRFYRMVYIDVNISHEKVQEYRTEFYLNHELINDSENDNKIFVFLEKLMKISCPDLIHGDEFEIFSFELKKFSDFIKNSPLKLTKTCIDYIENGIILPLKVYLNKVYCMAYSMSGNELLNIYELSFLILHFKIFLVENIQLGDLVDIDEEDSIFEKVIDINYKKNIILWGKLKTEKLNEIKTEIDRITDFTFQALDYIAVFKVISKHFFNFISKSKSRSMESCFSNKINFDEEKYKRLKEKLNLEKITLNLNIEYEKGKHDYTNGALVENMSEIHLKHEKSYGHLFIKFLFITSKNSEFFGESFSKNSNNIILKLLQFDTVQIQTEILEIYKTDKEIINFNYFIEYFFKNLISAIFSSNQPSVISFGDDYLTTCTVVKIFKFLCEEHNQDFQKIFLRDVFFIYTEGTCNKNFNDKIANLNAEKKERKIMFFDIMLLILNKISLLSRWEIVNSDDDDDEDNYHSYFYDLFASIIELLVEMIQGTNKENLDELVFKNMNYIENDDNNNSNDITNEDHLVRVLPSFLNNIKLILFRDIPYSKIIYNVRNQLVKFLVAFLEEKACPLKIKTLIISNYYPKNILGSIVNTLKKYNIKINLKLGNQKLLEQNLEEIVDISIINRKHLFPKAKNYKKLRIDEKMYSFFVNKYISDENFSKSPEFEFANTLYIYLKLIAIDYDHEEAMTLIESTYDKIDGEESANLQFNEKFSENYYTIKFFEGITKTIMIQVENKITRIIFTLNPLTFYLSLSTKNEFLEIVNRETRYTKLFCLIESTDYFHDEIIYNYKNSRNNAILRILNLINYYWVSFAVFLYVFGINIFMICVLTIEDVMNDNSTHNYFFLFIAILQIIITAIFVFIWIYSKFPLYYQRDKKKYLSKNLIDEDKLTNFDKLTILFGGNVLSRKEITGLIWCLIFGITAITSPKNYFLYSISLLCVVTLSKTLNNIILAIKLRWKQLILTAIFGIVIIYCYACISFFFFNDYFIISIHGETDNQCQSLKYCFLTHLLYGLRHHGGIGDIMHRVDYVKEPSKYIGRFFFDFLFFIMILIVILNVVFGIIIDTFRELRIEHHKEEYDKINVCFICGKERDELEKESINYINHINEEHNVWNYVYYIIGLKFIDIQDANAINSYAMKKIENKEISWIPAQKININ